MASISSSPFQTASALAQVAAGVGVEHLLELAEHERRHVLDAAQQLARIEIAVERADALADVLGEIADPLQIVGHAQRGDDFAQIHRHRLAAGDGEDGLLLDLLLQRIDGRIGRHHALGEIDVAAGQRLDGVGDLALGEPAHLRDLAGQLLQIAVERLGGVFVHHGLSLSAVSRSGR